MRISCDPKDPGYITWAKFGGPVGRVDVYLDDVIQRKVITADEENGFVERFKTDGNGFLVVDYVSNEVTREYPRGVVRIEIRPQ